MTTIVQALLLATTILLVLYSSRTVVKRGQKPG